MFAINVKVIHSVTLQIKKNECIRHNFEGCEFFKWSFELLRNFKDINHENKATRVSK